MQTVAEMPEFIRNSKRLLDAEEIQSLISYLAEHPSSGVLMAGTGGVRKLRWAREGMGKRGGVRVIYYFHSERLPLYLLTIFGKNEKADLSKAEANSLSKLVGLLIQAWGIKS